MILGHRLRYALVQVVHCMRRPPTEVQAMQCALVNFFDGLSIVGPNRETFLHEYSISDGNLLQCFILWLITGWSAWRWTWYIIPEAWTLVRWIWKIKCNVFHQ